MAEETAPPPAKGGSKVLIIILICIIAVLLGAVIFLFIKSYSGGKKEALQSEIIKEALTSLKTPEESTTAPKALETTPAPSPAPSTASAPTVGDSPRQVVDQYMKATLGTIPGAKLDYEAAKQLISAEMREQFVDASFVPQSYGIQEGPEKVVIKSENITSDNMLADVTVDAYYGGSVGLTWKFELVNGAGGWKILKINQI